VAGWNLFVRGAGATNATYAFGAENSSQTALFTVRNDGAVNVSNGLFTASAGVSSTFATLSSASTLTASTWNKWTLETVGVTAKARQGSDGNGLNFTTNAQWTGSAWAEDDTTKKKFAYIQHLGNQRHEFRTAPAGGGISWTTSLTIDESTVNVASGSLQQGGNQVLHAGNYNSYALPLSGGTLTGTLYFTDTTNGIYKSGGRLTIRSESTDDVANFASYGLYLPKSGQTAGLYLESPIEARAGLRIGPGAGSGTITVGATTAADANRLVQRDSNGHLFGQYIFGTYFNSSAGNSENPTIGQIWTQNTSDNYLRKSTPAHFTSQLGLLTTSNYSSYALPLSGGTMSGIINGRQPTISTAITSVTAAQASFRAGSGDSNVGSSAGFIPALGQTSVYTSGYRSHMVVGSYRTASGWGGGPFVAWGGSDSNATEYWLFNSGGSITYSGGRTFLDSSNYTSYPIMHYPGGVFTGNFQDLTNTPGELRIDQVNNINGGSYSNQPPNVYTYGGVLSWRLVNHSFQLYASHTGDLTFKTQWDNDNYSGWRRILHEANYTSFAPSLTGSGASGTWGISVTGSAGSAGSATTSTTQAHSDTSTNIATTAWVRNILGARTTGGTADWNDVSNTRPGTGYTLLLGTATNGMGGGNYYHPFNLEYASNNGTGNVTQMAYAYGSPANEMYMRGRYNGSWTGWVRFINSNNYSSYALPLSGGTLSGQLNMSGGALINAPNGFISNGNPWSTANSAFFPNGITTAGGTNWVYGLTYIGNAPGNGTGCEVSSNGRIFNTVSSGTAMHVRRTGSAGTATDSYTALFEQTYGNHSWGIVGEFRVGNSGGSDRPSILFSSGYNSNTWSVGFGSGSDDNFRINRDHGWRNSSWGTTLMVMDRSGNVTFTGNVTAFSDRRMKKDIKRLSNALALVRRLEGVSFRYKEDGREGIGLVAQEVEKLIPAVVGDATLSSGETYKNVAYGNIVAVLIEAVKELADMVEGRH